MAEFDVSTKTIELVHDSRSDKTPSPQYLCVDETKRPRANSDPVGLHIHISSVPEITVTGEDCRSGGRAEDDECDSFLIPPSPRRRANTCPEDMFRARKGRPPTPPPTDIRILRNPAGKRFSFNFTAKDNISVSFAHHRLSKVSEEKAEQKVNANQLCGGPAQISDGSCPSTSAQINKSCTSQTNRMYSRLQSHPEDPAKHSEHTIDNCVSANMKDLSVEDTNITEIPNKKIIADMVGNTDGLTSSSDSWRSKDNTRDNLDTQRLTAY